MGDAVLSELVKSIAGKICSPIWDNIVSASDVDSKIKELQGVKTTIEATLLDARAAPMFSHSQRDVLEKLECGLAELIDFLDAKASKARLKQLMPGSKLKKEMRAFFSPSNQLVTAFKDATKLKAITRELTLTASNHGQFGSIVSSSSSYQNRSLVHESGSHPNTDLFIGRDGDMDKMVGSLLDSSNAAGIISVASIVGMGGVGKTTLAQYMYTDQRIRNCFDVKLWISVTHEFNVKDVLRKLVASAMDEEPLNYEMDQLQQRLFRAIAGKRFLLVLDSVWDQDTLSAEWLKLRSLLRVGAQGSKVLLTTRSNTVARIMGTEEPHMVCEFDDDDHCWLLFKHVAFSWGYEPGMENIGKEIAKLCPRVPLVIRAIGSLLAGKTAHEWRAFRDYQITNFTAYGGDVMSTLKLSYDLLDERLKRCVLYCSLFPKGFEFEKRDLIHLWISLGYVEGEFTNQSLENVAEAYILCLLNRGFFYCGGRRNIYECPRYFQMHNLMHDLVISIAGFKYKMAESSTDEFDERVCHVSYATAPELCFAASSSLFKIKQLKSFLLPIRKEYSHKAERYLEEHEILISRVQSLRVLRMHKLRINKLPRSLGDLTLLRYLDLSFNAFRKLPKSVTQLVNLYLLDLSYCKNLEELPKDINKLVMLRHLLITGCSSLSHMPKGLGKLTGLETLEYFVVGRPSKSLSLSSSKNDLVCGLADLRYFDNINSWLDISLVHRSEDVVSEAKAANLHKKEKITHFRIDFSESTEEDEMVLDNLKPGANLTSLGISGYAGKQLACWMREGIHCWLPYLVQVVISDCNGCIYLCSFGRLPHLRSLELMNMEKVEYIENGSSLNNDNRIGLVDELSSTPLFPSLEDLDLINMPKLKGWWSVTDTAQDPGLYQLQKWIPGFPKLKDVGMDMGCLISLIKVFPQQIYSLRTLYVHSNHNETAEQPRILFKNHLPMLTVLCFCVDDTKVLPEEFQGMSSLRSLFIRYCEAIPDWIDSLTSLSTLEIGGCPRLKSLPSQISNLSNLKILIIFKCSPDLIERCQEPAGEDWPKIQHIPYISIGSANDDNS